MKTRYLLLSVLAIVAGLFLWILPMQENTRELSPEMLLDEIKDQTRYYSTDQVAKMIIENDPSILLVDVRTNKDFEAFKLPGSINIPMDSLLLPDPLALISDDARSIVFISRDGILAEQSWLLCKRWGMKNIHVMKGGLDRWVETILNPELPPEAAAGVEHDLYQARLGARQFFTGTGNVVTQSPSTTERPQNIPVTPRKKKTATEGGC